MAPSKPYMLTRLGRLPHIIGSVLSDEEQLLPQGSASMISEANAIAAAEKEAASRIG